jgi:hypothetical protein
MPQVWLDRFAAYYRIWSALSGLGGDLTAYRSTLLEPREVWDRRFGAAGPDDPGYSQEEQAEGYATFALYHYADFEWQLRQFETLYGGQWLLSDAEAEQAVADAVYRVWWHTPCNERDRSYLRIVLAQAHEQEMHEFISLLRSEEIGRATEVEWLEWVSTCECAWSRVAGNEYFPTPKHHSGISDACQMHQVVEACADYLDLVNRDWARLADWYHVEPPSVPGVNAELLYRRLRDQQRAT